MSTLHHREFKLRLTDSDADLIQALARRHGEPPAVLLRRIVRNELALALDLEAQPADRCAPMGRGAQALGA